MTLPVTEGIETGMFCSDFISVVSGRVTLPVTEGIETEAVPLGICVHDAVVA